MVVDLPACMQDIAASMNRCQCMRLEGPLLAEPGPSAHHRKLAGRASSGGRYGPETTPRSPSCVWIGVQLKLAQADWNTVEPNLFVQQNRGACSTGPEGGQLRRGT